jgi:hypothetical protein
MAGCWHGTKNCSIYIFKGAAECHCSICGQELIFIKAKPEVLQNSFDEKG